MSDADAIELRPLVLATNLDLLVEMQRRIAPAQRRWNVDRARLQLADFGREGGANVMVAWRSG